MQVISQLMFHQYRSPLGSASCRTRGSSKTFDVAAHPEFRRPSVSPRASKALAKDYKNVILPSCWRPFAPVHLGRWRRSAVAPAPATEVKASPVSCPCPGLNMPACQGQAESFQKRSAAYVQRRCALQINGPRGSNADDDFAPNCMRLIWRTNPYHPRICVSRSGLELFADSGSPYEK
jgi:hypothetical protein